VSLTLKDSFHISGGGNSWPGMVRLSLLVLGGSIGYRSAEPCHDVKTSDVMSHLLMSAIRFHTSILNPHEYLQLCSLLIFVRVLTTEITES
jgi:hypothetical protein